MESITELLGTLSNQPLQFYSLIFFCFLFLGEPVVLAASIFFISYDIISLPKIILIAFLSALIAEILWFYVGRFPFIQKIFLTDKARKLDQLIVRAKLHRPITLLFITRLFTGLTIAAIIYLGAKKIPLRHFLTCSFLVNVFWTPVAVFVGYLTGHGYLYAAELFSSIHLAGTVTILILLVLYYLWKSVYKRFLPDLTPDQK